MAEDLVSELQRIRGERENLARQTNAEYEQRQLHWKAWHQRVKELDAIVRGEFHLVFPDGSSIVERPKVPNIIERALKERAGEAASVPFSLRCDPANERSKARAEKRERIASCYLRKNRVPLLLDRFFMDLSGVGADYKLILPDFDAGYPCIKRIDPRSAYPDRAFSPDKPIRSLLIAYEETLEVVAADHPGYESELLGASEGNWQHPVTMLEFYDSSQWLRVCVVATKKGKRGVTLMDLPNRIGRVPVAAAVLPSPDGQLRGEYDQVLPVLNAENTVFNLLVDSAEDWTDSPIVYHDIANIEDYGKAALKANSPQGFARRMPPDQANSQIFALLAQMQGNARIAANYPEGRTGTVQQNIISAAGINALQASYNVSLAQLQRLEAASWEEALGICFAIDEAYLDTGEPKFITGSVNAQAFSESYVPSRDIRGDHDIRVEYGGAAGSDQFNYEIRLVQQAGANLLPRRMAMEKLSTIEDVLEAEKLLDIQAIRDAAMGYMQAAAANPQQPDFAPAAMYLEALEAKDVNPLLVMAKFVKERGAPQQTGMEAFQQAGALARGGQAPAPAGPENVPGVGALPPLESLLAVNG